MMEDAVRMKLTRNLPKFTTILSEEMKAALEEMWPQDEGTYCP